MTIRVFYAGLLYGEYTQDQFRNLQVHGPLEIYNGAYVHKPHPWRSQEREWFRMDLTPVLQEHVPKELLVSLLLLT